MSAEHKAKIRAAVEARPAPVSKRCPRCDTVKPASDFGRRKGGRLLKSACRACERAQSKIWRNANPDRVKENNRIGAFRKRGSTEAEYLALMARQGGRCAICGAAPNRLWVDHCHATGAVRGLLCNNCNAAIGFLQDDHEVVLKAAAYLRPR